MFKYILTKSMHRPSTSTFVSKSDIVGPIDYLSDIENLVLFEGAMFEEYVFKYRIKILLLFMLITLL